MSGALNGLPLKPCLVWDARQVTVWLDPPLVGERVVVRQPAVGDEAGLVEMATDERVRRFLGGAADPVAAAAKASARVAGGVWGQFVVVHRGSGDLIGSGDLARKRGPWEVSYQLRHRYWGRGLAAEAVALVRGWFFAHTEHDLLIATTQQANDRSRRLLERLGAVNVGAFEQYGLVQQRYEFYRS
ncbi:GNAT family N-acetyltransferase [Paractinoplanes rishiriensis]|uniref:N-acetyltransferase domain-containing protein n=1 Tax=Paractinoplanes rishiriensis TaxID=1050105 RepID=A0A919MZQ2_9ACTN|nr:GNAT family N-acetyltransferase [Actinoplanes rishiriensis]GIF01545.1 hypothetical protein Ari01nite_90090 [Actinoplanes rishiriensis]